MPISLAKPHNKRAALIVAAAFAIFALVSALAFRSDIYRSALDPASSTGSFEAAIQTFRAFPADARRDVLVLGDSRIYSALDPDAAQKASGGFRFLNAGIPGTTPRCWPFFARAIDPNANRFRAVVIPVDTYHDDDSAIGSLDGDDRPMDLRYVVFQTRLADLPKLAGSFSDPRERVEHGIDLFLRGPEVRDDVQAFVADPASRIRAISQARNQITYAPLAAHPRAETLAGLRADFARGTLSYPNQLPADQRAAIANQVLVIPKASASYARYRREWLFPIARRYEAGGVPVIFVRIPTRPLHRLGDDVPSGSLVEIARATGARFLPAQRYLDLERPELFADEDHLNRQGSARFSDLLGAEVGAILRDTPPQVPQAAAARPPAAVAARARSTPVPSQSQHHSLSWFAAAAGIGIPLQFQSYEFWLFFAIVAALFYLLPRGPARWVLLLASYYFYARWNAWYVLFLWILTVSDFLIAIAVERAREARRGRPQLLLALGIAANLAFLGTFKYANFASSTVAALIGMHQNPWLVNLFVPIGISFHTFQSISYLVDVHRGRLRAERRLFSYALYLAFFPQLLAGPIVRAWLFLGELIAWRKPSLEDVTYGLARAGFGLIKKMAVADQFAAVANEYFGAMTAHPGAPAAWSAMFAFSLQIYFDFSGYSDIAIGCARVLGFVFPENFNAPYLATSITDFWHRWHITLSTWLRDYLYIPLGGNRYGIATTLRNLLLTMLLGGLWHGAAWTFVAWGGFHGVFLCVERLFGVGRREAPRGAAACARILCTFLLVTLAWVLFRAQTFATAIAVYRQLFAGGAGPLLLTAWQGVLAVGVIAYGVLRFAIEQRGASIRWFTLRPLVQSVTLAAVLLALELFTWSGPSPTFIYFKF
ncbi:MAG: MBOAT family protein [Candidatus Eremiobacteraeota bacterium]|nr:MBOAT family protein [Candidatus Eremiobacteraeota bacterium]MBV9263076.1 MBOAT family protein [Candidatus Eremiobacteraeota bacterium]